jgi:hypothetical protein
MNSIINTINMDDIHLILKAIRYANPLPQSSIHTYLRAQGVISDKMPSQLQDYHVALWLSDIITAQHNLYRTYLGLSPVQSIPYKADLIEQLRGDYRLCHIELEAWSTLFVRYVCLLANLSPDDHADLAQMTTHLTSSSKKRR